MVQRFQPAAKVEVGSFANNQDDTCFPDVRSLRIMAALLLRIVRVSGAAVKFCVRVQCGSKEGLVKKGGTSYHHSGCLKNWGLFPGGAM